MNNNTAKGATNRIVSLAMQYPLDARTDRVYFDNEITATSPHIISRAVIDPPD